VKNETSERATILLEVAMLSEQVTKELLLRQIDKLSPDGLIEVAQFIEFLQFRAQKPARHKTPGKHDAFGIWADYPSAQDAAAFAQSLRDSLEKRQDG
jgi:delta 1-pyrroline-5-carboxylate dehydrogenase